MNNNYILETHMLTKKYGNNIAVNNVNIHIKKGRIYALLGRNGAGKTTIMKMILGLCSVTSGNINILGKKVQGNEKTIYKQIGSIIETPGFYPNLTATENLKVFAKLQGRIKENIIKDALDIVGLPYNDKKSFSSYSLGMKQRLGIANAIINNPEILILDEPTNGLDPIGIAEIRNFLKKLSTEQGKTIIISSHILSEMELLADDIGIIHQGNLLEEFTIKDLKNNNYLLIQVSSIPKAIHVLEKVLNITNYSIESQNFIKIYENTKNISIINKTLITSNIEVSHLQLCADNLENHFKKITGGVGIA